MGWFFERGANMSDTHFDAIIVGSGFGGSVSAYRLAEGGLRVCLLERGKAYPPGSFARRPRELASNVWDPSEGAHGLFNVWSFRNIEAVISSGLGGGSLIYANVLLRKDERWFTQRRPNGRGYENWPVTYADLEPHYDEVERMLGAQRLPFSSPGYSNTAKTRAMKETRGVARPSLGAGQPGRHVRQRRSRSGAWRADRSRPVPEPPRPDPAARAGCAESATSAATTAARTPSTTRTCPRPSTSAPTSGCGPRSGRSRRGTAAGMPSSTSSTCPRTRGAAPGPTGCRVSG